MFACMVVESRDRPDAVVSVSGTVSVPVHSNPPP